jgi:hypothetical protein
MGKQQTAREIRPRYIEIPASSVPHPRPVVIVGVEVRS